MHVRYWDDSYYSIIASEYSIVIDGRTYTLGDVYKAILAENEHNLSYLMHFDISGIIQWTYLTLKLFEYCLLKHFLVWDRWHTMNLILVLLIVLAWRFSTRPSVSSILIMHPWISIYMDKLILSSTLKHFEVNKHMSNTYIIVLLKMCKNIFIWSYFGKLFSSKLTATMHNVKLSLYHAKCYKKTLNSNDSRIFQMFENSSTAYIIM